jgi:hypothetical protein
LLRWEKERKEAVTSCVRLRGLVVVSVVERRRERCVVMKSASQLENGRGGLLREGSQRMVNARTGISSTQF